jgi:hypothetical protein
MTSDVVGMRELTADEMDQIVGGVASRHLDRGQRGAGGGPAHSHRSAHSSRSGHPDPRQAFRRRRRLTRPGVPGSTA